MVFTESPLIAGWKAILSQQDGVEHHLHGHHLEQHAETEGPAFYNFVWSQALKEFSEGRIIEDGAEDIPKYMYMLRKKIVVHKGRV